MDRFVRGFIIGMATSAIKDILSWIDYLYLGFTNATYAHLMGAILFGRRITTASELVLAQIIELGFEGFIGVLFIYFAYRTFNQTNLWFKGVFFANAVYVSTFAIGSFFRVPVLYQPSVGTSASTFITSTIYGVFMGLAVYWWGKRVGDFEVERVDKNKSIQFKLSPYPARKIEKDDRKVKLIKPKKL